MWGKARKTNTVLLFSFCQVACFEIFSIDREIIYMEKKKSKLFKSTSTYKIKLSQTVFPCFITWFSLAPESSALKRNGGSKSISTIYLKIMQWVCYWGNAGASSPLLSSLNRPARASREPGGFAVALQLDSWNKGCPCSSIDSLQTQPLSLTSWKSSLRIF